MLEIDPQAIVKILPLATEALAIQQRAAEREAKHAAELKKKGIAEVPPCDPPRFADSFRLRGARRSANRSLTSHRSSFKNGKS